MEINRYFYYINYTKISNKRLSNTDISFLMDEQCFWPLEWGYVLRLGPLYVRWSKTYKELRLFGRVIYRQDKVWGMWNKMKD